MVFSPSVLKDKGQSRDALSLDDSDYIIPSDVLQPRRFHFLTTLMRSRI